MKIKCIIIDDEPLAIKIIEKYLSEFPDFEIIAKFNNPLAAVTTIEEEHIDVMFLDIKMSKMDGLAFIKTLDLKTHIIITTAYREYAVESFDLDVVDYLVKPIPFNRFLKAINRVTQHIHLQGGAKKNSDVDNEPHMFLKVDKKLVKIKFEDILYIESLKDYIRIHTLTSRYLIHKSLTSITEELPSADFLRIHRSYTIAIDKVQSVEGNSVEIASKRLPIGRKYIDHAKRIILKM